jgi:autotransporter-associated beta strand protein
LLHAGTRHEACSIVDSLFLQSGQDCVTKVAHPFHLKRYSKPEKTDHSMKPRTPILHFLSLAGSSLLAMSFSSAATLYWDATPGTPDGEIQGGTGTWNTDTSNWYDGSAYQKWANENNDTAVFGGTSGVITLGTGIKVGGLSFRTNGYTINSGSSGLSFGAANNTILLAGNANATITGTVGGSGNVILGPLPSFSRTLTLNGTSAGGWSGTTTLNLGSTMALAESNQALLNTTGINLNGGGITLTNTDAEATLDRVSNSAPITSYGGSVTMNNPSDENTYAESIGSVALAVGQTGFSLATHQAGGGSQTLTLGGLTRSGASNTSNVIFVAAGTAPNATTNQIVVTGEAETTIGQILGPWATTGTTAILQTDFAAIDASSRVIPAAIAATTEDQWTTSANAYTFNSGPGATVLSTTRTVTALRSLSTGNAVTADAATDRINLASHTFVSDAPVVFTGTMPGGLTAGITYYVRDVADDTFKVSTTPGGAAIDLTTAGSALAVTGGLLVSTGKNLVTTGILSGANGRLSIAATGTGAVTAPGSAGGRIYFNTGGSVGFVALTNNNTILANAAIDVSAPINDNGGAVTVVKTGDNSVLRLSGAGNYSGGTVINAGILLAAADSNLGAASGSITLNGGQLRSNNNNITFNRELVVGPAGGYFGAVGNQTANFEGRLTGSGTFAMVDTAGAGPRNVQFNSTANDFTGAIVLPSASAKMRVNSLVDGSGAGDIIFYKGNNANECTFEYGAGAIAPLTLSNRAIQIINNTGTTFSTATLTNSNTSQPITVNTDVISIGFTARLLTLSSVAGPNNSIAGKIGDGAGGGTLSITKTGAGIWSLAGTNSYTGVTKVSQGTLRINSLKNYGVKCAVGAAVAGAIQLGDGNNVGTLVYTGGADSSDRTFQIGNATAANTGGAIIESSGNGALTLTAPAFNPAIAGITATRTLTLGGTYTGGANAIQGVIQDNNGSTGKINLAVNGAATWILSGANTYSGGTTISGGTLTLTGATQATNSITFTGGSLGLDTGFPVTAASAAVNLANGTIKVTGSTGAPSYTLLTAASITGTPVLASPVSGYELQLANGDTELRLVNTGATSPYDTWSGGAAFDADANGDGVKNGLAFLLGASGPIVSALDKLPVPTQSEGALVLTFQMLDDTANGNATLAIEYSNSLAEGSWTAVEVPYSSSTVGDIEFNVTGTGLLNVTATIPLSKAPGGKLFGRIKGVNP